MNARFGVPVAAALLASVVSAGAQQLPDGPVKQSLEEKCSMCHSPTQVMDGRRTPAE